MRDWVRRKEGEEGRGKGGSESGGKRRRKRRTWRRRRRGRKGRRRGEEGGGGWGGEVMTVTIRFGDGYPMGKTIQFKLWVLKEFY